MKNKRIVFTLTISLLLTACGGSDVTPSEPTPSESFTPSVLPTPSEPTASPEPTVSIEPSVEKEEYVFNDSLRESFDEVISKYENNEVGSFDRYFLEYSAVNGDYRNMYADKDNNYYYEYIDNKEYSLKGDQYYYIKDGLRISATNFTQSGKRYKNYKYLTKNQFAEVSKEASEIPFTTCPSTLKEFSNLTNQSWKDVVFEKLEDDKNGNIHISLTGKQLNSKNGSYWDDGRLSIDINNYIINKIHCSHDADYVFNQDPFELNYPDLTAYNKLNEPPKDNIEEEPLKEEEFLVNYDNNRTYYQLLVYSFADSDGDGVGDFKGIVDKLNYLKELGIEGIWLSPCLQAGSYHGYDIEDYYAINPSYEVEIDDVGYGINYLLKECHKAGIKVLMDLVINHTSANHIWYQSHGDWYGNDNRFGYPEFNFDKQEVREAIKDVGRYWLERGFDGFRLDAAMWIYNYGSKRHQKNYEFWNELCSAMKECKPDCYLIGEVLDDNHELAYNYANAGFDSTFDFNALGNVINAVSSNDRDYATNTYNDIKKVKDINENYILGRALSNHDIGRFNQEHPDSNDKAYYVEDIEKIKLANAINTLTPGNTFIYYGDELGLKGTCEDTRPNWYYDMNYRTPMPWENGRTDSIKYFASFHGSGVTTSVTYSDQSVEQVVSEDNSIYDCLRNAVALKNSSEILQKGVIKPIDDLPSDLNGFDVNYNNETIRILFYGSNDEQIIDYEINTDSPLYSLGARIQEGHAYISANNLVAYKL